MRILEVKVNTQEFDGYSQKSKLDEFKENEKCKIPCQGMWPKKHSPTSTIDCFCSQFKEDSENLSSKTLFYINRFFKKDK